MTMGLLVQLLVGLSLVSIDLVGAATSSAVTTSHTPSTSPFRTVNYITHSLAQQCLPSSRKASVTSAATEASEPSALSLKPADLPNVESGSTVPGLSISSSTVSLQPSSPPVSSAPRQEDESALIPPPTGTPSVFSSSISAGIEEDSPLDGVKFMSFEDWKRENLKQSGQSEHIGRGPGLETREPRRRPVGFRDSLDSLGDDTEIDLDFSGFVSDGLEPPTQSPTRSGQGIRDPPVEIEPGRPPKAGVRSKDAGTTCKERFNYASFDCAASVLKWNPEAKSPSAVLGENKDSYMLNKCSAQNKFLILELCNDISIDTIVVANFEFFSSTFQTFRVSVSDKYPVKVDKWKTLGTFEARNSREVQAFLVENPVIWARYLRIEFLSHYGNEFYCPLSLVRVHGTTMLEDYKRDLEALQMEDEDRTDEEHVEELAEDGLVPDAIAEQLLTQSSFIETPIPTVEMNPPTEADGYQSYTVSTDAIEIPSTEEPEVSEPTSPTQLAPLIDECKSKSQGLDVCEPVENDVIGSEISPNPPGSRTSSKDTSVPASSGSYGGFESPRSVTATVTSVRNSTTHDSSSSITTSRSIVAVDSKPFNSSSSMTSTNGTKIATSSSMAPQSAPTMQESFFKSVQKRLQMLEANSSLSLQYIEDQSRSLRDAFQKVEQRQLAKTTSFLEYLNTTVLNELREFRLQYDQLWQSTVIELEMQRERYQRDNVAINARLGVLADEIIFQKRVSFLQLILIVVCLGLILFSKGNLNSYLELPLVQSVLSRSPSTRSLNIASPDTPTQHSPVSRSNSTGAMRKRLGILKGHRRFPSEDSTENTTSPIDLYTPSTPISYGDPSSEGDLLDDNCDLGDPEFDPSQIERPSTSPPALAAIDSPASSDLDDEGREDSIASVLNMTPTNGLAGQAPVLIIEDATPPLKRLTWQLPDG